MPRHATALPAHVINGITVAVGIALVHALVASIAGAEAAQLSTAGAICTSLADLPGTVRRTRERLFGAVVLSVAAAILMAFLKPWPAAMGIAIGLATFVAMMTMAWGPRAGPMSFSPVLAMVFAMAVPHTIPAHVVVGSHAAGAVLYMGWSIGTTWVLRRRYRTLALAATLRAIANLLRSRASILESIDPATHDDDEPLRTWVGDEAILAERLQAARDMLFAAPDTPRARRETAILLRIVDLRDALLASRLDLHLFGHDAGAAFVRERLAAGLRQAAAALDEAERSLRAGKPPVNMARLDFNQAFADGPLAAADPRRRLLPSLTGRLQQLSDDVHRINLILQGHEEALPLQRSELQLFVAPEGWPLAAVWAQLTVRSPVMRHALRLGLALSAAYFIGKSLPWASHPHWLVLSVAVVLRGNLEQTLARRNARVIGTMLGCLCVLALAQIPPLQSVAFLLAIGVAHTFTIVRYMVTATAGTVMALMQAHLVDPAAGFAITERVADTVLGAVLAWGFSYVLPSWERRSLSPAVGRTLAALRTYAHQALLPMEAAAAAPAAPEKSLAENAAVAQRLARLQAYDALGMLAAALQRSAAEPKQVRVPVGDLAQLLDHAHRLMAHLSVIRMMLTRRAAELQPESARAALVAADDAIQAWLVVPGSVPGDPLDTTLAEGLESLPDLPSSQDPMPWLVRRLQATVHDAHQVEKAVKSVLGRLSVRAA